MEPLHWTHTHIDATILVENLNSLVPFSITEQHLMLCELTELTNNATLFRRATVSHTSVCFIFIDVAA